VKAHDDNYGNELVDHLAKEAACGSDVDIAYIKIPKSAVASELKEKGLQLWQSEWDASNKGELTKNNPPYCKRQNIKKTANVHKLVNDCKMTW
jgi:hypothetical protein